MGRLIHKPEGSIDERLKFAKENHGCTMIKLLEAGWSNENIASHLGLDKYTVRRFRKEFKLDRKFRLDHVPYFQNKERTEMNLTKLKIKKPIDWSNYNWN